jgi:hypothetical protein
MKDYSAYKDQYYDKLLQEFTKARGIEFLQEPQDILEFERYIEMEFAKLPKDDMKVEASPTTQLKIATPAPLPETEEAILITNGYQKVL